MNERWPRVRLGKVLRRSEEITQLVPDVEYREITVRLWGKGVIERRRVLGAEISGDRRFAARPAQFIVSRIDARNGAMGLVPPQLDGAIVTNDFPLFALDKTKIQPEFLGWLCQTREFVELCQRASEGTTNRVRLQEGRFLALEIPLPPLAEQRRIVAKVDQLAAKIAEVYSLRQQTSVELGVLLDQSRTRVFEKAASHGTLRLDEVAILERGKFSHRPRNEPRFFGGEHPWIQIAEVEQANKYIRGWTQTLNDEGLAISKKFPRGTVLISIAATIGAVGILDFDCCVPDSIVGVTPRDDTGSEFLYHYLSYVRTHLEMIAPQSAQKNINLQILSPLPVPRVKLKQQRRIVACLDELQAEVSGLKQLQAETSAELDAMLPSILDKAFKGEL
jgi:type I restriction enzyme S subunit